MTQGACAWVRIADFFHSIESNYLMMGGTSFLRLLQFIPITFCDNFKVSENSTRDYGLAGILDLMIL